MFRKAYINIILGFIISLIKFKVEIFNISYIIGYFLIGYGAAIINESTGSKNFKIVNDIAIIFVLSLIIFPILINLTWEIITMVLYMYIENFYGSIYSTALTLIYYSIRFTMVYYIFNGFMEVNVKKFEIGTDKLETIQMFYIITNVICLILLSFSINISNVIFMHFLTILLLIMELFFIAIFYRLTLGKPH